MDALRDFEDMLFLFHKYDVRYLIIGGLAFIYHAKPRYTKDMDLWVDPSIENITRANHALSEFGSPTLIEQGNLQQIIQISIAPNRIDLILFVPQLDFELAWKNKIDGQYGDSPANWIDIDGLIQIKEDIDSPRHQDDAENLRRVRDIRKNSE